jgi:uracil-DNA glycosylase
MGGLGQVGKLTARQISLTSSVNTLLSNTVFNVTLRRLLIQHLQSYRRSGVTHWHSRPREVLASNPSSPELASQLDSPSPTEKSPPKPLASHPAENESSPVPRSTGSLSKKKRLEQLQQLQQLQTCVADCRKCSELAETRTQTVFGVGNPNANIMFIGEAPGADEDRTGEPFVGRAGKLMNKIIEACEWNREDLYIANILKCRPPGNRNPDPTEAANCREFLDSQISLVNPGYIICWGSVASKNLLSSKEPIGKMRKQLFQYGSAKVLCTYHPSYLLRNPPAKKDVWEDLQFLIGEMD